MVHQSGNPGSDGVFGVTVGDDEKHKAHSIEWAVAVERTLIDEKRRFYPGLPQVARAWHFARQRAPALLLVPEFQLGLYQGLSAFGADAVFSPDLEAIDGGRHVVLAFESALWPVPRVPEQARVVFEVGASYPREALLRDLRRLGHERGDEVRVLGEVVEIGEVRLEFFGDVIERIVVGEKPESRWVLRAKAEVLKNVPTVPFLEVFQGPVFLDQPSLVPPEVESALEGRVVYAYGAIRGGEKSSLPVEPLAAYRGQVSRFVRDLRGWLDQGLKVVFFYKHPRARDYLLRTHLQAFPTRVSEGVVEFEGVLLVPGPFEGGFVDREAGTVYLTEALLYGFAGASSVRRGWIRGEGISDPDLLSEGDYLIHPEHGIGRFLGLETREVLGVKRDYLVLKYRDEGKLYVPVEDLPFLRRHPATSDELPELSSLAKKDWKRTKERARRSAEALAQRLVVLYAKRQAQKGQSYPPLPEWDPLIEANFPHELTADQKQALEDVMRDLEAPRPMDRLISGDVGFGKTEVALRAAYRVVGHGSQVVFLVPTTLLAEQHYRTFRDRFRELPVQIEMLSRFTPRSVVDEVLKGLARGTVDIVIGTHRLLEPGVRFKDLGLLIVDEEHRFGVAQKERLRELQAGVDTLYLSATPIPRTLYQALVGLKDISAIQTPPPGRKPIRTVIAPFDPLLVREAILFEIERGGKVFYVHDRVASIDKRGRWLSRLVPEARIGVVHGQMPASAIEEVMLEFERGAFDVLVATTIVESGLDVPMADTIVIERADRLGLAQLYQLRGRVGRREREAWAYLFHPEKLTETAEKRLAAIADLSDLGTGHLLAERDMEIRGVGNLLGPEQHGHVRAVSLEVYAEMVAEAVRKLQGAPEPEAPHVTIDLKVSAYLPPDYIADEIARSRVYSRLARAKRLAELSRIRRALIEDYGPLPEEAENFLRLSRLRLLAERRGVRSITEDLTQIQIAVASWPFDYDARSLKETPFPVEVTRYPPGFRVLKKSLRPTEKLDVVARLLELLA